MCDLRLEVGWQVDDVDGAEWALLWADTTSDAEGLGDEGNLGCWINLDTEASGSDDWAGLLALLTTFLDELLVLILRNSRDRKSHLWLALFVTSRVSSL